MYYTTGMNLLAPMAAVDVDDLAVALPEIVISNGSSFLCKFGLCSCYMNPKAVDDCDDQKSVELCVTANKLMIQSNDADCAANAVVGGPDGDGARGVFMDGDRKEGGR